MKKIKITGSLVGTKSTPKLFLCIHFQCKRRIINDIETVRFYRYLHDC